MGFILIFVFDLVDLIFFFRLVVNEYSFFWVVALGLNRVNFLVLGFKGKVSLIFYCELSKWLVCRLVVRLGISVCFVLVFGVY